MANPPVLVGRCRLQAVFHRRDKCPQERFEVRIASPQVHRSKQQVVRRFPTLLMSALPEEESSAYALYGKRQVAQVGPLVFSRLWPIEARRGGR